MFKKKEFQYGKYRAFTITFNGFVMYLLNITTFVVAGIMLYLKAISLGTVTAAMSYVERFIWPVRYLIDDINDIQAIKKVLNKVETILQRKSENLEPVPQAQELSLENVNLSLEDFRLNNINFNITQGQKVAIIGHSGSGKSTIFKLLTKQLAPQSGEILIGQQKLSDYDFSYSLDGVYQGNHIYEISSIANIAMFNSYSMDKLNDYLLKHPNQKIEDLKQVNNCQTLSNGEKQIVSLLRTFLSDPPIVLLDEVFSSIDRLNRSYFLDMFLKSDKTVLAITHDTSEEMLSQFDKIIHIENGSMVD